MPRSHFTPAEVTLAKNNLAKARELMHGAAEDLLALGDVLNALRASDLYLALGEYLSFRNFLRKEKLIPYSTAQKYMVLAAKYKHPNSRKLGVDKLVELLRLAAWEGKAADDIAANDEVVGDRPVSDHTVDSLALLRRANEERRERLEAERDALAADPALAQQHKDTRGAARRLEAALEKSFAGPDAETRAVRQDGSRELRVRIDLSLTDALELIDLLKDHQEG